MDSNIQNILNHTCLDTKQRCIIRTEQFVIITRQLLPARPRVNQEEAALDGVFTLRNREGLASQEPF